MHSLLGINESLAEALQWLVARLAQADLFVLRTFDLQSVRTRALQPDCLQDGQIACDCHMVVLMVYEGENGPAEAPTGGPLCLVAYGIGGRTNFTLEQGVDERLEARIRAALSA